LKYKITTKGVFKMKHIIALLALALSATTTFAAPVYYDSSDTVISRPTKVKCGTGLSCAMTSGKLVITPVSLAATGSVVGDGGDPLYGFLQNQIAATATTITAAQCGSTFYNTGAVVINLPAGAASLLGCRLTFITLNATNFDINPGNSDQILVLTDAAGDAIRNATLGNAITLQYAATNKWVDIAHIGTWADIN
jgi:hypothetical protein